MVNLGVGWLGVFFRSLSGLGQFDLIVLAVLASLMVIENMAPRVADTSGGACRRLAASTLRRTSLRVPALRAYLD